MHEFAIHDGMMLPNSRLRVDSAQEAYPSASRESAVCNPYDAVVGPGSAVEGLDHV